MVITVFNKSFICILLVAVLNSCSSSKWSRGSSPKNPIVLDTLELDFRQAPSAPYRIAPDIEIDVIHIELDLNFNWEKEEVLGKANVLLTAFGSTRDTINLDARGFELLSITQLIGDSIYSPVYEYDSKQLSIVPLHPLHPGDTTTFSIGYIARPSMLEIEAGSAITSNQGLYFINPRGNTPNKPQQIWTQGEPECNSSWFPSVDYPHEKITHEIFLTVDSSFHTISNGKLVYSSVNEDGTRTDYWKQSLPHSNYLVMIAVGEFALVKDMWRDIQVWYYLDSAFIPYAMDIFGNTPEMIEFYSTILGYEFPWDKYHQVVVKDFVSGAMENTSAVIHGDFVQLTDRELLDENHEDIIAHELFHHWFGDLVTCKDWSQLTLNEGFATYGEYLWIEHKYGKEAARHHLKMDIESYLNEASREQKPLIRHHYHIADDIFDSHTYQKGGRVMHLLRKELGDADFFKTLNHYLNTNAFGSVQLSDLQKSAETVSGKSLSWFFNQWFEQSGHPIAQVDYILDEGALMVVVSQLQKGGDRESFYRFHLDVALGYPDGSTETRTIWINQKSDTTILRLDLSPSWYCVDPLGDMLWQVKENKSSAVWHNQLLHAKSYIGREAALIELLETDSLLALSQGERLLSDSFWLMRVYGVELLNMNRKWSESIKAQLIEMTQLDPNSYVRSSAYRAIDSLSFGNKEFVPLFTYGLNDRSYQVVSTCLASLYSIDPCYASNHIEFMEKDKNSSIQFWISRIYASCGGIEKAAFFSSSGRSAKGFDLFLILNDYTTFAKRLKNKDVYDDLAKVLTSSGIGVDSWWVRHASVQGLNEVQTFYAGLIQTIESTKETTVDDMDKLAQLRIQEATISNTIKEINILQDESNPRGAIDH